MVTPRITESRRKNIQGDKGRLRHAKRNGKQYQPVKWSNILEALANWRTAESVGEELWPHLIGQGPNTGGPSSAAVAATFQLKRLERAGKVISDNHRPTRYRRK